MKDCDEHVVPPESIANSAAHSPVNKVKKIT